MPSNGEQEWYINSNYGPTSGVQPWTVSNGILTITAAPTDPSIRGYLGYNEPGLPAMGSYNYTSGFMTTASSFQQTYGYFEISAKIPAGQGLWPAFWLMPTDGSTLPELDVMEALGQTPTTLVMSVHTQAAGYPQLFAQWATGLPDLSQSFHRYGLDWEPGKITYYLDGKALYQLDTPADMNKPMYMIANLAVGGNWPGAVDPSKVPAQFQIDYIRAYSDLGGAAPAPVVSVPSAPTGGAAVSGSGLIVAADGYGQTLSGAAGADTFVFKSLPWTPAAITNFELGVDRLDLSALEGGYTGSNPVGDGYVRLFDDGAGGTKVLVTSTPGAWPSYVVDVKNVPLSAASAGGLFGASAPAPQPAATSAGGAIVAQGGYGQTLTGGAGADTFVFKSLPWTPAAIGNFQVGVDHLDLSALYPTYAGTNPIADGYVQLLDDGAGGAEVLVTPQPGAVWPTYVVDLKGVSVGAAAGLFGGAASGGGGSTPAGANVVVAASGYGQALSGSSGADTFVFKSQPWTPASISGFQVGVDHLDLSALWPGYTGSNPAADGHVTLLDDGAGGTKVLAATGGGWPTYIVDLKGVSLASATGANLFGASGGGATTGGGGVQLVASPAGGVLNGTSAADHFVFPSEPWTPVHIAGFTPGVDVIDLKALFAAAGYQGSDPFADHYLVLQDDGAGGTRLLFDPDGSAPGHPWPDYIANLDHTAMSSLHTADFLWR